MNTTPEEVIDLDAVQQVSEPVTLPPIVTPPKIKPLNPVRSK
jgi:hypothetical protein